MMGLHVHGVTNSADCDGTYTRRWVIEDKAPARSGGAEPDEYDTLREAVLRNLPLYGEQTVTLVFEGDGLAESACLAWPEEEGGTSVTLTLCNADDCNRESSYRDHAAERAGY